MTKFPPPYLCQKVQHFVDLAKNVCEKVREGAGASLGLFRCVFMRRAA